MDIRANSDCFLPQLNAVEGNNHWPVFITEIECLLRGSNWIFKNYSG